MRQSERCRLLLRLALVGVQLLPAAVGSASPGSEAGTPPPRVHVVRLSTAAPWYSPQELTVEAGDVVRWANGTVSDNHSACDRKAHFTSPDIVPGAEWCFRFDHPGHYSYVCRMHPWMRGSVNVVRRTLPLERPNVPRVVGSRLVRDSRGALWLAGVRERVMLARAKSESGVTKPAFAKVSWRPSAPPGGDATHPQIIAAGRPDAARIWVFDTNTLAFGYADRATSKLQLFDTVQLRTVPETLAAAPDGTVWFTTAEKTKLGRFDPSTSAVREYSLGSNAQISAVDAGAADAIWAADVGRNRIIQIRNHWITGHAIPTPASRPRSLAVSNQGDVWFAGSGNRIGCIRAGDVKEFDLVGGFADTASLAFDAVGNLWLMSEAGEIALIRADVIDDARAFPGALTPQPCVVPDGTGTPRPRAVKP